MAFLKMVALTLSVYLSTTLGAPAAESSPATPLLKRDHETHCGTHGFSYNDAMSAFDDVYYSAPWQNCGGLWAPTIVLNGKTSWVQTHGNAEFYVCNNQDWTRCFSLDWDSKRNLMSDTLNECAGYSFWIWDDDKWSYGMDAQGVSECGF